MTKKAKVDILLPYWGDFNLLKEAVDSVIAQTEQDWRLLIVDDHYPSLEAQSFYSNRPDKRIVYIRHASNIGITKNFNFALGKATAKYCVMFGCDDKMLPNYIERALQNIGEADFYQPGVDVINEHGKVYLPLGDRVKRMLQPKKSGVYKGEKLAASLCRGNWLYFPSILWKTSAIKKYGFDNSYKIAEDVVLELNTIKDGGSLYFDKYTTFHYRRFSKSLSSVEKSKGGVRFREESTVYNHFAKEFRAISWKKAALNAKLRITSRIHQYMQK